MPKCGKCQTSAAFHELRPVQDGGLCLACIEKELATRPTRDQVKPLVEALQACRDAASHLGYIGLPLGKTIDALNHAKEIGL